MIRFSPPYIDDDIINEVTSILQSGWLTTGPATKQLEKEMASFCNVDHTLAVNSATSGMILMLHWYGIKEGDEVIVPAYTYCATALAVMHVGAKPVMVDVGSDFNIDCNNVRAAITERTKAIIAVDFAGWPCDYDGIYSIVNDPEIRKKFRPASDAQHQLGRIMIMDDAAHALGATYKNKPIGSCADITVFSLHAVKNITSAEGGVIAINLPMPFNSEEVYNTLRIWSLNGQTKDAFTKTKAGAWQYDVIYPGFKMNMPDVLAAVALAQFKKYENLLLIERKRVFDFYTNIFSKYDWAICPPYQQSGCSSSYHLYPLRIKNGTEAERNKIIEGISGRSVAVNVHFTPLPMLTVFKQAGYKIEDYPASFDLYSNEISLPIYPQLTNDECRTVTEAVIESVKELRPVKTLLRSILFPVMIMMGSLENATMSDEREIDDENSYSYAEGFVKRKAGRYYRFTA
ncbi:MULTISPECIES: DegT/DnrJ/EryC1/StrS family aminotransferase [Niastella]|uniref:DegT/DnrJ/EryC1/StrS family aminotransferase n=1 Tax=Niastella soli TaxID=2821487 RepID=A0ABS3YMJ9_9BACT|nr:DegT/DnrJ/EryC1/StrS family aminotransferase [Niastella soli]MBO9198822.1 DegT/DnrJ/EryC1/StrS family aminotransferase [Niastella soli]